MLNYVICEILDKQYKFIPGESKEILWKGNTEKQVEADVLLLSEDGKLKIGKPYLKDKIILNLLETKKGKKIRVSKFHAKANYRKVIGFRSMLAKLLLDVKNPS